MFKKALSILLACLLIATSVGVTAFSVAAADAQQSAAAGDLTISAKSNFLEDYTATVDSAADQITVSYFVQNADMKLMNAEWFLTYDPEYLELVPDEEVNYTYEAGEYTGYMMKFAGDDGIYNFDEPGRVDGNTSKLAGYKISSKVALVSATFKPLKAGKTDVELFVNVLTFKKGKEEPPIVDGGKVVAGDIPYTTEKTQTAVYAGEYDPTVENPEQPVEATTVADVTEAPATTVAPVTDAPATTVAPEPVETDPVETKPVVTDYLKLTATSNFFPEQVAYYYDPIAETVTVTYNMALTDDYRIIDAQFEVNYDPEVLECTKALNEDEDENTTLVPAASAKTGTAIQTNYNTPGNLIVNFSNYNGIRTSKPFAQVTFKVLGKGATTVDLVLSKIDISNKDTMTEPESWIAADADMDNYVEQAEAIKANTTNVESTLSPESKDPIEEPEKEVIYNVAGTPAQFFGGAEWANENPATVMTKNDDGTYSYVIKDATEQKNVQFKVLKDYDWSESWGDNGGNYVFNTNGTGDVTITFNPETKEITVTGDTVYYDTELVVDKMYAVGNGEGTWLNGLAWGDAFESEDNVMTEVSDKVYEITFNDIPAFDNWQIKFAANGGWASNWGNAKPTTDPETGAEIPAPSPMNEVVNAVYDGGNIIVNVDEDDSTVIAQLDLTEFDFATKEGAKYKITVIPPEAETLDVVAATDSQTFTGEVSREDNIVTVTYKLTTPLAEDQKLVSTQFKTTYDPEVLKLKAVDMPFVTGDSDERLDPLYNTEKDGEIQGNVSDLKGFRTVDPSYATFSFEVLKDEGETTVLMNVADFLVEEDQNYDVNTHITESGTGTIGYRYLAPVDKDGNQDVIITFLPAEGYELAGDEITGDDFTVDPEYVYVPTGDEIELKVRIGAPIDVTATFKKIAVPESTTVEPTTVEPTTVEPTTVEPTTVEPTTVEPTTVEPTTVPSPSQDATSASEAVTTVPTTTKAATSDSATKDSANNSTTNNNAVQTGSVSMAIIILLVLLSGTAAIFFARRKQDK